MELINGERFRAHPAAAFLEDRTEKGRRTATMEVMEAMEDRAGSAGCLGQDERLLSQWRQGQWTMEKQRAHLRPGPGRQVKRPFGLGSRTDGRDGVNQGTWKDVE